MATILITGANRGLGLEFARQYAANGDEVLACCRQPERATALGALAAEHPGKVRRLKLEVTSAEDRAALADALADQPIDILLLSAGVFPDKGMGFGSVCEDTWVEGLRINTIAPLKIAEALIGSVERSERKVIATVTSLMGSIADNTSGGYYIYRSSKAAVNMVMKSMARDLRSRGVTSVLLHPGWVQTDMGGAAAPLQAPESCAGMRKVLEGVSIEDSGKFFRFSGEECPW